MWAVYVLVYSRFRKVEKSKAHLFNKKQKSTWLHLCISGAFSCQLYSFRSGVNKTQQQLVLRQCARQGGDKGEDGGIATECTG